ncbi:MAG: glycoside hydrolase family 2 protein [Anaerolineaceae bacterium]|nr:glycoside hydrolase family 2 protein [Anaerolineaceae bacterium]
MKQILSLNGSWNLFKSQEQAAIPASVPGCVHTDLLANKLLENPFYRDNELQQMWVGETDWRYSRSFNVTSELLSHDRVLLRCHGLDTIATLYLNGALLGSADNMFRTWEYDVKPGLHEGENTLEIQFAAPMPYVRRMDAEKGEMAGWVEPMRINSGAWIRKEPCNFGWDWGPKMPTCGIWRDIELVAFDTARLTDVNIQQEHYDGQVALNIKLAAERAANDSLMAAITISKDGKVVVTQSVTFTGDLAEASIAIPNPELWWVNNFGEQPLYTVEVVLQDTNGKALDSSTKKIGLRTLTLERHSDEWGESFYFACNGVPFFAKGADWIPASPYPGEAVDYKRFIQATADANMNMLRVWGGGIYEEDAFYDMCDEYGIAIWQDFMFACGTYPSFDTEFMENVKAEAEDNIKRIRHHACMALWCGNNEIEQGMPDPSWKKSMSWEDYSRLFDKLLADLVHELAPQTAYWPGSPHTSLGDREDHRSPESGDTHLWDVWHGKKPFEWYHTRLDRFVSEFGFQSFPEPETVSEFTLPEDRNITSYVMEHHQRSGIGNSTIIHYLLDWFRLPTSFESTLWLSQILQAMAMKYAVEHWRRNMPRSMGALYWQLNDMWPAPSWASLDWKGNWKALHYMARRFNLPLMVSGVPDWENHTVQIHVTNDMKTEQTGTVEYTITDAQGNILEQDHFDVSIDAGTTDCFKTLDLSELIKAHSSREVVVWLQLKANGETISEDLALFCRPKHLNLKQPQISTTVRSTPAGGYDVELLTDSTALYVWLELSGAKFGDNFVHLRPNTPKTIHVATDAIADLKVKSLFDTYQ